MAKKKITKRLSTDADEAVAKGKTTEEMLEETVDSLSEKEQHEILDMGEHPLKAQAVVEDSENEDYVYVRTPVHLKIKRQRYEPGVHRVPRHLVAVIREMVDKKTKADMSMFTGSNKIVQRLMDRSLVITEVDQIDLEKLASK